MNARGTRVLRIGQGLIAVLMLWHASRVNYAGEDSYISFRYARHLLDGHGLVYNAGERVEGYSNFLWVMLLAGVSRAVPTIDLPILATAGGVVAALLSIALVFRFPASIGVGREVGLLAGLFLAAHSGFVAWSTAGLETPLFAALIFGGAAASARYLEGRSGPLPVALWFGLAALTRADGAFYFVVTTVLVLGLGGASGRRAAVGPLLRMWAGFLAICLPYLLWRHSYYGEWLPNTAHAKTGGLTHLRQGTDYIRAYIGAYGVLWWAPLVAVYVVRARDRWVRYFVGLIAAHLLYLIYLGGDSLGFFRFVVHLAPLMYTVLAAAIVDVYRRYVKPYVPGIAGAGSMAAVVTCLLCLTARPSIEAMYWPERVRWLEPQSELSFPGDGTIHQYTWFGNYFVDRLRTAARYLEATAPPGAVVASTPAGAIAYYMDHPVIDMLGLTDPHIARSAGLYTGQERRVGHEKGDGAYVLSRRPDYVLLGNVAVLPFPIEEDEMEDKLVFKSEHEIWALPEFHADYGRVAVRLAASGPFQYFTFYRRKVRP